MLADVTTTRHGIPIRNVWYMLAYALGFPHAARLWMAEAEQAPGLHPLLLTILVSLMERRLRFGLGRSFIDHDAVIRGIRGRVRFEDVSRRALIEKGYCACSFSEFSVDVPQNRIVKAVLRRSLKESVVNDVSGLRQRMRRLIRDLAHVRDCETRIDDAERLLVIRTDQDYRLMLAICVQLMRRSMPAETEGARLTPGIDRDEDALHRIFESFVARFYRQRLATWLVSPQHPLSWHAIKLSRHLPRMVVDLQLSDRASDRVVFLDTKFTARSLSPNQFGQDRLDSAHLYQMSTYVRTQLGGAIGKSFVGVLLYPTVGVRLRETIIFSDHSIHVASVDLSASWQAIDSELLALIEDACRPESGFEEAPSIAISQEP